MARKTRLAAEREKERRKMMRIRRDGEKRETWTVLMDEKREEEEERVREKMRERMREMREEHEWMRQVREMREAGCRLAEKAEKAWREQVQEEFEERGLYVKG